MAVGGLRAAFIDQPLFWDNVIGVSAAVAVAVSVARAAAIAVFLTAPVDEELVESLDDQEGVLIGEGFNRDDGDHMIIIPCSQECCIGRACASVRVSLAI